MGCEYGISEYLKMLKVSLNYVTKYYNLVAKDWNKNFPKVNQYIVLPVLSELL
jgi:hypothetical protein